MADQRELAELVLATLREGVVPWQYPVSGFPQFRGLFGTFITGDPLHEAEADFGKLDRIIEAVGVKIIQHPRVKRPRCERPPNERILMPPRSRFLSGPQYRATTIHEVLHALEQPQRVGWIGSEHQAEIVAEVGTGFVLSHLRLPPDLDTTNIRRWFGAWAEGIKADPAYLTDAVAQGERAARYLLACRNSQKAMLEKGNGDARARRQERASRQALFP